MKTNEKTYKIFSPAYEANGLNGTYYSIAICDENDSIIDIIGDHRYFIEEYKQKNINYLVGLTFSDSDRFIMIEAIECDIPSIFEWEKEYTSYRIATEKWEKKELEFCNWDRYRFFYNKRGKITENHKAHDEWKKNNPYPVSKVGYYDFLKSIINEN